MNDMSGRPQGTTGAAYWPVLAEPGQLAEIMGGTWTRLPTSPITTIRHRLDTIEPGLAGFLFAPELFCKLNGTKAHLALLESPQAASLGAAALLVTRRPRNLDPGFPCLIVSDPAHSVEKLARHNRTRSGARFIAVTGSVGKTTTKNMIHQMVSQAASAHCTIANYNARLRSIYFTLSSLCEAHRYCVAEFSEVGSLEEQLEFFRPHISVITNVLPEHVQRMERLGHRGDDLIRHLADVCAGAARHLQPGGVCVLNADAENHDKVSAAVKKLDHITVRTCGVGAGNDVRIVGIDSHSSGSDITISVAGRNYRYKLGLPGHHMALNSVAAATAVHFAGLDLEPALQTLCALVPGARRGTVHRIPWHDGQITLRDESVSSSLPSFRSSLAQTAIETPGPGGRRIAVLGPVNEMGVAAPAIMRELARVAEESSVERFYTIGEDVRILNQCISDRSRVAPHFQTLEKLESALRNELVPGDVVVLKGDVRPENISLRRLADRLTARPNTDKPDLSTTPGVRLVIGGDTYFGESYQAKRARESDINYLETFGYDYSGEKLAPLFRRADYAVANLECALTTLKRSALMGRKSFVLGGKPDESVRALKNLNIGGVLLGNNHAMDYLGPGLAETLASLEKARIQTAGGGKGRAAAQQPIRKTFDVGGIPFRVAIVSAYEFNENHDDMGFYAGEESLGINNINTRRLSEQIAGLKADGYFVIVSPHWGTNYSFRTFSQSSMATRIIGCGADLILGHGAHMMNEIVRTDGVWVVYSLGNLIFNSEGEYVARQLPPYSLVAELEFARKGAGVVGSMNLYPIVSCNQMTQFQPTFVDDDQFQHVVALLSGTKYDRKEFEDSIVLRQVDGRHCISMKLF